MRGAPLEDYLAALLKQLLHRHNDRVVYDEAVAIFRRDQSRLLRPSLHSLFDLIGSTCRHFETVYLVVDGLDEFPPFQTEAKDSELVEALMQAFGDKLRMLCTSRPSQRCGGSQRTVEITADEEDIRTYIVARLPELRHLYRVVGNHESLKVDICDAISKSCQGM